MIKTNAPTAIDFTKYVDILIDYYHTTGYTEGTNFITSSDFIIEKIYNNIKEPIIFNKSVFNNYETSQNQRYLDKL